MNVLSTTMRSAVGLFSQVATYTGRYVISTAKELPLSAAAAVGVCAFKATGLAFSYFQPYDSYESSDQKMRNVNNVLEAFCILREFSHAEINSQEFESLRAAVSEELGSRSDNFSDQEKKVFQRLQNDLNNALLDTNLTVSGLNKDEQMTLVNFYEKATRECRASLGDKATDAFKLIQDTLVASNLPLTCDIFVRSFSAFEKKFEPESNKAKQLYSNNKFKFLTKLALSSILGSATAYSVWLKIMSLDPCNQGCSLEE